MSSGYWTDYDFVSEEQMQYALSIERERREEEAARLKWAEDEYYKEEYIKINPKAKEIPNRENMSFDEFRSIAKREGFETCSPSTLANFLKQFNN